jgi:hypothetical protein
MRAIALTLSCCLLSLPSPVDAQEGFEADRLQPCLALEGLAATCRATAQPGSLKLAAGWDGAWHLLALTGTDGPQWLVEHRHSLRLEAAWAPAKQLVLLAGLDGVA